MRLAKSIGCFASALSLMWPAAAGAQSAVRERIDATPQSPPLVTDDPGVPDDGQYEINFTTDTDATRRASRTNLLTVDANYGLRLVINGRSMPLQIEFECPLAAAREAGKPYAVGVGAAAVGVKLQVYHDERTGISVAASPEVEFAAPGARAVEKGLSERGQTWILPLLVAKEFRGLTVVFNAGLAKPTHDPERQVTTQFGAAVGRRLTSTVASMIELRIESSPGFRHDRLVFVNGGLMHRVRHMMTLYINVGHSLLADDGSSHTYIGVGMKLLIDTKKKAADEHGRAP